MTLAESIRSARLDLVSMSRAFLIASLEGRRDVAAADLGAALPPEWPGASRDILKIRLADLDANPAAQPWLLRAMVARAPIRRMVGHIGFCDPPGADQSVEVGYTVQEPDRRNGYASEAVLALCRWAAAEHGIVRCRASISPENAPSLRLAEKLGFVQTGERWDEIDGLELVYARNLSGLLIPD